MAWALLLSIGVRGTFADGPRIELKNGDRVILLGDALLERDRKLGAIETMLRSRFPSATFQVRNLSRPGGPGEQTLAALDLKEVGGFLGAFKPTVALIGYSGVESTVDEFAARFERLADLLAHFNAPRVYVLSPLRREKLDPPLPDPKNENEKRKAVAERLRTICENRKLEFVDLYSSVIPENGWATGRLYTENGVHLTPAGYERLADVLAEELGFGVPRRDVRHGAEIGDELSPLFLRYENNDPGVKNPRRMGLLYGVPMYGKFELRCDGEKVAVGTAPEWALGIVLTQDFYGRRCAAIQREVVRKDDLWYKGWAKRRNAPAPILDAELEAADKKIQALSKPQTLELVAMPERK
jgi:hypothetical protein